VLEGLAYDSEKLQSLWRAELVGWREQQTEVGRVFSGSCPKHYQHTRPTPGDRYPSMARAGVGFCLLTVKR
jgi:hypothetical protein